MDKNMKKYLAFGSTIAGTILLGMYTQSIEWLPALRTLAHFGGAMAVPGFSSLFFSNFVYSYENNKTNKINKKAHKDTLIPTKEKYRINPKLKKYILQAGMFIGSAAYVGFCSLWESWQFNQSQIFQLSQYLADIGGPLLGMATIGTIDCRPLYDKIDSFHDRIRNKFTKNKGHIEHIEHIEPQNSNEKQNINSNQNLPSWDLRLYNMSISTYPQTKSINTEKTIPSKKPISKDGDLSL